MRIFFNTYPAAFQCPGGGEIQLLKSKEALERRGHEVVLFNQWEHGLVTADVLHQFSVQGGTYNICAYARGHGIPLVVSPILWLGEYVDQYPMSEIAYILSSADVICPNSQAEADRFVRHFDVPAERYHVTHNGVDAMFFDEVAAHEFRSRFGIQGDFALCVGNIECRKNQKVLVEAAANTGVHVVLIGNVREYSYFSELKTLFPDKFSYLGHLEHDDPALRSAYAACSVFALPSVLETPGLAALEAAAAGAPLVVTSEGCTQEYFGENAIYVDPKSVSSVAQGILTALTEERGARNLADRVAGFTWDNVAEELEAAYLKAISAR